MPCVSLGWKGPQPFLLMTHRSEMLHAKLMRSVITQTRTGGRGGHVAPVFTRTMGAEAVREAQGQRPQPLPLGEERRGHPQK